MKTTKVSAMEQGGSSRGVTLMTRNKFGMLEEVMEDDERVEQQQAVMATPSFYHKCGTNQHKKYTSSHA